MILWWFACRPADPVPDDLSPPVVWLLTHLDEAEDDVVARVERLDAYARRLPADGDVAERTFDPGSPDDDDLRHLPDHARSDLLISAAIASRSEHELADHLTLIPVTPRACLEGPAFTAYDRDLTDGACIAEGVCDDALADDTATLAWTEPAIPILARTSWRLLPLTDGRDALVGRSWLTEVGDAPPHTLRARYAVDLVLEDPEDVRRAWRVSARWADLDSPSVDGALRGWLADEPDGAHQAADATLDGDGCGGQE